MVSEQQVTFKRRQVSVALAGEYYNAINGEAERRGMTVTGIVREALVTYAKYVEERKPILIIADLPISDLKPFLSTRTYNALRRSRYYGHVGDINTIGDVYKNRDKLHLLHNMGKVGVGEVTAAMRAIGMPID